MNTQAITILHETEDYLVVNKPAGMLVHPYTIRGGQATDESTLAAFLVMQYPELQSVGDDPIHRPGIVHRLDRDTSGVLVVARNQDSFLYLKSQFQAHAITKEYEALVHGVPSPSEGTIEKPIGLKNGTVKRTVHGGRMVKDAITTYRTLGSTPQFSRVLVIPRTGRTHQIRVHMSSIGNPLVGDEIYGTKTSHEIDKKINAQRCMLHARALSFTASSGVGMRFEVAPPSDFEDLWNKLSTRDTP